VGVNVADGSGAGVEVGARVAVGRSVGAGVTDAIGACGVVQPDNKASIARITISFFISSFRDEKCTAK
jgi:hypothetical protein